MNLYHVIWKVKNNSSSVKDAQQASNVIANSEEEAIEAVKRNNPATRDKMYDFEVRRIR